MTEITPTPVADTRLAFAKMTEDDKRARLETKLLAVIALEKKAGTRVKRAATLLQRYQKARRRLEAQIGRAEITRITARLVGEK